MLIDFPVIGQLYYPLALSRNAVVVYVDPLSPTTYPDRADLRYEVELYVQEYFQSNNHELFDVMEGSERPAINFGSTTSYTGADFDMSYLLDDLVSRKRPEFGQTKIQVCESLTRSYYAVTRRKDGTTLVDQVTLPAQYLLKAGLAEKDVEIHGRRFFYDRGGKFLTWSADRKAVRLDQPEFLYFLTNFSPQPSTLKLRARFLTSAGEYSVQTLDELTTVAPFTVYCLPVGPANTTLAAFLDDVVQYEVWVSDTENSRLSEIRTYRLDRSYHRHVRYLLFANSLGGFDTLTCIGRATETFKVTQLISERYDDYQLDASYAERVMNDTTGERELSINTGPITRAQADYLTELMLAEEIYLVADRDYLPLLRTSESTAVLVDDERLVSRTFSFRYANKQRNYSNLPALSVRQNRPTGWRSVATACEVNANGLRTGRQLVTLLERYYLDDNNATIPPEIKPNLPSEDGYMAPSVSPACATTPYLNAQLSRLGTYIKNDCPGGQTGHAAMIDIAAGTYGSEISAADANAKAEAAYQALNTQAYANQNGTCSI